MCKHTNSKNRWVCPYFLLCAVLCLVAQLCLTLFDPMDYSLLGSSVHRDSPGKNTGVGCYVILQGISPTQGSNSGPLHCRLILYHLSHQGSPRILEWVACPFSRGSFQPRNCTNVSCIAGFPGSSDGKASAYNAGGSDSIPGLGRSPGEGNGNPLQYSCLESPVDWGAISPRGHKESDTTEQLHFFTSLLHCRLFKANTNFFLLY